MMGRLRALCLRFRGTFHRSRRDQELRAELESHLQMHIEDHLRSGMTPQEARRQALVKLGGWEQTIEGYRERQGLPWLGSFGQDVGFAWRMLGKNLGFTSVATLTLAFGIAANTGIFRLVDVLFFKPLPVPNPEQLVHIYARGPSGHYGAGFSYPEFTRLRDRASSFAGLSAETPIAQLHLETGDGSEEIGGAFVSANYFDLLGIHPKLGRSFLPEEDAVPNRDAVAVISDQLWKVQFHADPAILGHEIRVNGVPFNVVGVAPPGFRGDRIGWSADVWIPSMMLGKAGFACDDGSYNCSCLDSMIGRLIPGQLFARAQAEAESIIVWSAIDWREKPSRRTLAIFLANGASPDDQGEDRAQMQLLMSVTGLLLLIACANLAGLLLARGVTRRREIAVRLSIGATPSRILRQLLTESLLLALLGGCLGLGFSFVLKRLLLTFYATDGEGFRHLYDLSLDGRALAYSMALILISGALCGLVPAIRASRQDLNTELKGGGPAGQPMGSWLRNLLVSGQIALCVVLVVTAGLLVRSAREVQRGTNFDPAHVVVLRLKPELVKYNAQQVRALILGAVRSIRATPGVESVAYMEGGEGLVWSWHGGRDVQVSLSGPMAATPESGLVVRKQDISPDFLRTLHTPLVAGREFTPQDGPDAPRVAVLNEALASRLWPQGTAVGRMVMIHGQPFQVIGVAADIQPPNGVFAPEPHIYFSYWQSNATSEGDIRIAVRVRGDPNRALPTIRRLVQSLDPEVPIGEDMSMSKQVSLFYMPVLLARTVVSYCGICALCLSAMGLYSLLAFAVRARIREIGIRMALGAPRKKILALVLRMGVKLALAGVVVGSGAALALTRLVRSLLFHVSPTDPTIIVGGNLLLVAVALTASYLPARRAASVDPVEALRSE
jgi:predicted permease